MRGSSATSLAPSLIGRFWVITLGKKVLMAVSGVVMVGFATGHMVGNLQLFIGQEQLNKYAVALQDMGALLWFIRAFLFIWFALHVWSGIRLWIENTRARPIGYKFNNRVQSKLSTRFMTWTGLAIIAFVIYHLLHFTLIVTNPDYHQLSWQGHRDVYSMVVLGFQNPLISAAYIISMIFLALHLRHAIYSVFQTIGFNNAETQPQLDKLALVYSWVVFLGYLSMPIAVLIGLVKLPGGGL